MYQHDRHDGCAVLLVSFRIEVSWGYLVDRPVKEKRQVGAWLDQTMGRVASVASVPRLDINHHRSLW
jgi:hypothetical protein